MGHLPRKREQSRTLLHTSAYISITISTSHHWSSGISFNMAKAGHVILIQSAQPQVCPMWAVYDTENPEQN